MRTLLLLLGIPAALAAQRPAPVTRAAPASAAETAASLFDAAQLAWDKGQYIAAIDGFTRILTSTQAGQYFDAIAELTGELYRTIELTPDGARPVFSRGGNFAAYETGVAGPKATRIVSLGEGLKVIAELPGTSAAFAPSDNLVAFLKGNTLVVRDLRSGAEVSSAGEPGMLLAGVVFGTDDNTLFLIAGREGEVTRNDILRVRRSASGLSIEQFLSDTMGFKSAPVPVPGGRFLLYSIPAASPIRQPGPVGSGRGAGGGAAFGRTAFAIAELGSGAVRRFAGSAPSLSADGAWVAYLVRAPGPGPNSIMVAPVEGGEPITVKQASVPLDAPALSPDGQRVAFQMMAVYDQEIYLIDRDGKNETRLTRDIQHDVLPKFLGADRLLAVQGEPRHRRSFLYDTRTLKRTRLFDNNSVRTIAPEYEWVASHDGAKLLIVAERDGNTVSLERGVYLSDLNRKVTREELLARLVANRAAEVSLRDRGLAAFQPIAAQVRAVTSQVEVSRIYRAEKAMFDFDSKHISMPGNARVIQYLADSYRSFGYQPELQWFEPRGALGGRSANVIATLKGTENPELVYVVSSHFDSRAEGPGADDDASGTAALLEAARVMARHPMPVTIVFASFTGEEAGLLGSREFVRRAVEQKLQLVGALNNDMVGWANDYRLDNTIRYSNPGIRDIQHAAAQQFSQLITYDALYYKSTDAQSFYDAYGDVVGGIGSYPVLGNPHYHQPHDALEVINHQLVAEVSKTTVATLMLLASSPSRLRDLRVVSYTGKTAELRWTPSPERGVLKYVVSYGPPGNPEANRLTVPGAGVTLKGIEPGMVVQVKAVNSRGLAGWDWARVVVSGQ